MASTLAALTVAAMGNVAGLGTFACLSGVHTAYAAGGNAADLSSIFPSTMAIQGAWKIAGTSSDGGILYDYVPGTGRAPASGKIQAYGATSTVICGQFAERPDTSSLSFADGERWLVLATGA